MLATECRVLIVEEDGQNPQRLLRSSHSSKLKLSFLEGKLIGVCSLLTLIQNLGS